MIKKAVITAGGLGLRFLPATRTQPKEMLPIVDKPAIHYVVEEAINSGIEDILIIIGRGKDSVVNYFDNVPEIDNIAIKSNHGKSIQETREMISKARFHYVRQDEPLGLGHAVYCAKDHVGDEPFALLLGDNIIQSKVPCIKQMTDIYEKEYQNPIIAIKKTDLEKIGKYGVIQPYVNSKKSLHANMTHIEKIIEKPKPSEIPSNLAMFGRYILTPKIFDILKNQKPGLNNEIQISDALNVLNKEQPLIAYEFEGEVYDIGNRLEYLRASIEIGMNRDDIGEGLKKYLSNLKL